MKELLATVASSVPMPVRSLAPRKDTDQRQSYQLVSELYIPMVFQLNPPPNSHPVSHLLDGDNP
jgi:hypothetical protein